MAFDRSRFKASSFETIQKEEQKQKETNKTFYQTDGRRAPFYTISDGRNWLRVLPSSDPETAAYVAMRTTQLPVLDDEWENGEKTGRKVMKNKEIFIATTHCGAVKESGLQDPVEFYIQKVFEKAEDFQDENDKKKFLFPIQGGGSGKNWKPGCIPQSTWVCYVQDAKRDLYRLELRTNWFNLLHKKSIELAEECNKVSLDMFSSPDDGFPLIIVKGTKTQNGKERVYYDVEAGKPTVGQSWEDFFEKCKISDSELERLAGQPSLKELYVDCYTTRDLNLALEGLKNLEAQHPEFDVLGDPDFEELVSKLYEIVPEPKQIAEDEVEQAFKKEESNEVTPLKMKKMLREYIASNYSDEGYTLPNLSKEDLVKWYQLAMEGEELPFDEMAGEGLPFDEMDKAPNTSPVTEKKEAKQEDTGVKIHDPKDVKASLRNILNRKK